MLIYLLPDGKIALFQNKLYYQNNIQLSTLSDINNIQSQINNLNTTISNVNNAKLVCYRFSQAYGSHNEFDVTLPQNVSAYNNLYIMCSASSNTADAYVFYDKSAFMMMHNHNNYLCSIHKLDDGRCIEERVKNVSNFATEVVIHAPRDYNQFHVYFDNLSGDQSSVQILMFTIA